MLQEIIINFVSYLIHMSGKNALKRKNNSSKQEHLEIEKHNWNHKKSMRDIDTESRRKFEAYR